MRFYILHQQKTVYFYVVDDRMHEVIATFDSYDDAELFCLVKNGLFVV
jgi:hypothetical protein